MAEAKKLKLPGKFAKKQPQRTIGGLTRISMWQQNEDYLFDKVGYWGPKINRIRRLKFEGEITRKHPELPNGVHWAWFRAWTNNCFTGCRMHRFIPDVKVNCLFCTRLLENPSDRDGPVQADWVMYTCDTVCASCTNHINTTHDGTRGVGTNGGGIDMGSMDTQETQGHLKRGLDGEHDGAEKLRKVSIDEQVLREKIVHNMECHKEGSRASMLRGEPEKPATEETRIMIWKDQCQEKPRDDVYHWDSCPFVQLMAQQSWIITERARDSWRTVLEGRGERGVLAIAFF